MENFWRPIIQEEYSAVRQPAIEADNFELKPALITMVQLFRPNYMMLLVYANLLVLPHKNFSSHGNNAKNLSRPYFICMKRWNCFFFFL